MEKATFLIIAAFSIQWLEALQWTGHMSNGSAVTACLGLDLDLAWSFTLGHGEREEDVKWTRVTQDGSHELVAVRTGGSAFVTPTFSGRASVSGGAQSQNASVQRAELRLHAASIHDQGVYTVTVGVDDKAHPLSVFNSTVNVTVAEPPVSGDGVLHVRQESEPVWDTKTGGWRLALVCGPLASLGNPPLAPVWMTPDGSKLESSTEANGTFRLFLPGAVAKGNYSCGLPAAAPAASCLPPASPLVTGGTVEVDDVKVAMTLLAADIKTMKTGEEQLKTEMEAMKAGIEAETKAQLEKMKNEMKKEIRDEIKAEILAEAKNQTATEIGQLKETMTQLETRLAAATRQVHFHARLEVPSNGSTLKPFNETLANQGDAFNADEGFFKAPLKGSFFFMATAGFRHRHIIFDRSLLVLKVNDNEVARATAGDSRNFGHDEGTPMVSIQAIVNLEAGDKVWVECRRYSYLDPYSTSFTGFLIGTDLQ